MALNGDLFTSYSWMQPFISIPRAFVFAYEYLESVFFGVLM